jgi:prevent-host-death family protein
VGASLLAKAAAATKTFRIEIRLVSPYRLWTELRLNSVLFNLAGFIMKLSSQIKPISYLKSHTAEIVKSITESREPLVITQNGEAKLVVMDVKSFEEQEGTMALLKLLAMGNREIEEGKFNDAQDVFAELDKADHQ